MHPGLQTKPVKACVVVPTYNNRETIGRVVEGIRAITPDVIVVDDGSTDGTADALAAVNGLTVVTHDRNLGKGAALRSGFLAAAQRGFTHAVTMDGDGQHTARDLPRFLEAVRDNPNAIVIGDRGLSGGGRRLMSRGLRFNSNFWVWAETGRWVRDTQSGFRAYPLSATLGITLRTAKYDFEIETLVKEMWTGVPVVEIPITVSYGPGSKSHFRPLRDFARVARLNALLMVERLTLPASIRREMHLSAYGDKSLWRRLYDILRGAVLQESTTPGRLGACVGLGVTFGILPIWGFQMAAAVVTAHALRLSKPIVVAASNISIPAFIPAILYASVVTGKFVLSHAPDPSVEAGLLNPVSVWYYAWEYLVGSIVFAAAAGIVAGVVSYAAARLVCALRKKA